MNKIYFKLFANCILVKGHTRSVICDLQRKDYEIIPNSMADVLELADNWPVSEIKIENEGFEEVIDEYINFLVEKEFGFWVNAEDKDMFPKINTEYYSPSIITNAILDFNNDTWYDFTSVNTSLENLGCKALQLRFYEKISVNKLINILTNFIDNRIRHIDLLLNYDIDMNDDSFFLDLHKRNNRIIYIIVHSSPFVKSIIFKEKNFKVHFVKDAFDSEMCCGNILPSYFTVNIDLYVESQKNNTCLNQKISIDKDGEIKNCPSLNKSYGSIHVQSLESVVKDENFKKLWFVVKDQIDICKDCEFRYICTDCRAFIQDNDKGIYAKPLKCNYDPYEGIWH